MRGSYTFDDLISALCGIGLGDGDDVFIHSNLGFFGRPGEVSSPDQMCALFVRAIREVIGSQGTLILPTFTYSFCHGEVYDPWETPTGCGMFPEYLRKQPGTLRSDDPNFSVAAVGKNALLYTQRWSHEAFGEGCFWEKFLEQRGRIACFNFDCGSTFVHYVEHQNQVSYRYNKAFNGVICKNGKTMRDYAVHYVYDKDRPQDEPCFTRLDALIRTQPFFKAAALGRGEMLSFPAKDYAEIIAETLKKRPRFLTREENE